MILRLFVRFRRYPQVLAALVVAAVAGIQLLTPWAEHALWLPTVFALLMAARSAWRILRELRSGTFGVDILAVTAIGASVVVGEAWAVIVLTRGEALEDYAANRAKRDLTALLVRAPQAGHRLAADGTTVEVPIDTIAPGDRLMVRANEIVPVDGTLISDIGTFDESSLTGESLPVERIAGEEASAAGSTVPLLLDRA